MIEIIPNWHPILVHFSIALYACAALLFAAGLFPRVVPAPLLVAARINLRIGALLSVPTVAAGLYAYATVTGETVAGRSAAADHRNWALLTAVLWWAVAGWEWRQRRDTPLPSRTFVAVVLLALIPLGITGWKGGELVYRYGVGVMPPRETALPPTGWAGVRGHVVMLAPAPVAKARRGCATLCHQARTARRMAARLTFSWD